eukprot:m.13675 g.13675  ORF g.13675 m.13675 type:complete len:124 (+) comp10203_c0_seq1:356-727(+)
MTVLKFTIVSNYQDGCCTRQTIQGILKLQYFFDKIRLVIVNLNDVGQVAILTNNEATPYHVRQPPAEMRADENTISCLTVGLESSDAIALTQIASRASRGRSANFGEKVVKLIPYKALHISRV